MPGPEVWAGAWCRRTRARRMEKRRKPEPLLRSLRLSHGESASAIRGRVWNPFDMSFLTLQVMKSELNLNIWMCVRVCGVKPEAQVYTTFDRSAKQAVLKLKPCCRADEAGLLCRLSDESELRVCAGITCAFCCKLPGPMARRERRELSRQAQPYSLSVRSEQQSQRAREPKPSGARRRAGICCVAAP